MNAFEIPNLRFSLPAHEAIPEHRFVTANASSEAALTGVGGGAIGVSTNETAVGNAVEIADGLVFVEASALIAAGATVESTANGRAVTRTTGVPLGIAITGAAAAGDLMTIKCPAPAGLDGAAADHQLVQYVVENLAAGVDLADVIMYAVPHGYTATLLAARIISQGTPAGIDDANTCVINIENGATSMAGKTYNTANAFPTNGIGTLTLTANTGALEDQVVTLSVTNGATADPPAFIVQMTLSLAKN